VSSGFSLTASAPSGKAVFEDFTMNATEKALIRAEATDYRTENLLLAGDVFNAYTLAVGFDCIRTTWWNDWDNASNGGVLAVDPPRPALVSDIAGLEKKTVFVDAQTCRDAVDVKMTVFAGLTDKISFAPQEGVAMPECALGSCATAPKTITVTAKPDAPLGVVPVAVLVKKHSESTWQLKEVREVYSLRKDAKTDLYRGGTG
jgi:hypothetical protein